VGPEHAWLNDTKRASYISVTDAQAVEATRWLARAEGIVPALESAHALAAIPGIVDDLGPGAHILVNLSGRGDKDMETLTRELGL
jgi:tryptophan synthase beta chain